MLGLKYAKFLLARGSLLSINLKAFSGITPKISPSNVLANRAAFNRPQTRSLAFIRVATASFSTHSNGLRMLIETDKADYDLRSANTNVAKIAFHSSNPFNDPKAHNCTIKFPPEVLLGLGNEETEDEDIKAIVERPYIYDRAKLIIRTELDKVVESAGHSTMWPIVLRPYYVHPHLFPINKSMNISFKLPSSEDPSTFFSRLKAAGLTLGELAIPESKRKADNWWYRCLFLLPKEVNFEKGNNKIYKVGSYVETRPFFRFRKSYSKSPKIWRRNRS